MITACDLHSCLLPQCAALLCTLAARALPSQQYYFPDQRKWCFHCQILLFAQWNATHQTRGIESFIQTDILYIPQGSVLTALLLLICINDITQASSSRTTSFADYINFRMSNSCFDILQTTVNLEICKTNH